MAAFSKQILKWTSGENSNYLVGEITFVSLKNELPEPITVGFESQVHDLGDRPAIRFIFGRTVLCLLSRDLSVDYLIQFYFIHKGGGERQSCARAQTGFPRKPCALRSNELFGATVLKGTLVRVGDWVHAVVSQRH